MTDLLHDAERAMGCEDYDTAAELLDAARQAARVGMLSRADRDALSSLQRRLSRAMGAV